MENPTIAIIVAGITAVLTVIGWNVSHYLARRREDRTRRIESTIDKLERQIEELYGPLLSLVEQIFNVWRVRRRILEDIDEAQRGKIDTFVWKEYFLPLHMEIRELLKTRLYLVERKDVRACISDYLEHSTQELFQKRLYDELGIDTSHIKGKSWPQELYPFLSKAAESIKEKREKLLQDLEPDKTSGTGK